MADGEMQSAEEIPKKSLTVSFCFQRSLCLPEVKYCSLVFDRKKFSIFNLTEKFC